SGIVSFFFSSRRRHTRSKRDWSSDVCSSDLNQNLKLPASMTFAILAGYQLLLGLPREWQTIRAAQLMRAGGARRSRSGKPKLTFTEARRLVFTVLIVTLRRSERIATSLASRGFG